MKCDFSCCMGDLCNGASYAQLASFGLAQLASFGLLVVAVSVSFNGA